MSASPLAKPIQLSNELRNNTLAPQIAGHNNIMVMKSVKWRISTTTVKQSNPKEFGNKNGNNNKQTNKKTKNKKKEGKEKALKRIKTGLLLPTEQELTCCRDLAAGPQFASQQLQTRHTTF